MVQFRGKLSGKLVLVGLPCLLVLGLFMWAEAQSSRPGMRPRETQTDLMQAKLTSSQKVLGGLVSKDFAQIRAGAQELNEICFSGAWVDNNDQVYRHHRTELHRLTQNLLLQAEKQNLEGAAFSYMHSLNVCISCHQYCRDVLRVSTDSLPSADNLPTPRLVPQPTQEPAMLQHPGSTPLRR